MFELTPFDHRDRLSFYHPFRDLDKLEEDFFVNNLSGGFRTEIKESCDTYLLEAELPGFQKDDIAIDIKGDYLTITAEHSSETEEKREKDNYVRRERSYGSFSRGFDISNVKADDISASYENGVLKLIMPKKENGLPNSRRLEIR